MCEGIVKVLYLNKKNHKCMSVIWQPARAHLMYRFSFLILLLTLTFGFSSIEIASVLFAVNAQESCRDNSCWSKTIARAALRHLSRTVLATFTLARSIQTRIELHIHSTMLFSYLNFSEKRRKAIGCLTSEIRMELVKILFSLLCEVF